MKKMKPKNKIKLHKNVIEVINSATELVNSMIELHKLKSKPITDYTKGGIKDGGLMVVGIGNNNKEVVFGPDGKEILLKGKPIVFKSYFEKGVIVAKDTEDWSKQLNKFLKEKGLNDSQPFGFAPIDDNITNTVFKPSQTPVEGLKTILINGVAHNVEYTGKGNYLVKDPVDFHEEMLKADKELQRVCSENIKSDEIISFIIQCPECEHKHKYLNIFLSQKQNECRNCYCCFSAEIINNKIIITKIK